MTDNNHRQVISQLQADLCSALADSNRLMIIDALSERSLSVGELADAVNMSQPSTSRHLKILRAQGLVRSIRRGSAVEYRLNDYRLLDALNVFRSILRDRLARKASLISSEE